MTTGWLGKNFVASKSGVAAQQARKFLPAPRK